MAIVEDTGGFSGIIVAAHELGHLYVPLKSDFFLQSLSYSHQTWGCTRRISPALLPRWSWGGEVQLGGRIHYERPEAHQQGLQVVPLHCQTVSTFSQVSQASGGAFFSESNLFFLQRRDGHLHVQLTSRGGVSPQGSQH